MEALIPVKKRRRTDWPLRYVLNDVKNMWEFHNIGTNDPSNGGEQEKKTGEGLTIANRQIMDKVSEGGTRPCLFLFLFTIAASVVFTRIAIACKIEFLIIIMMLKRWNETSLEGSHAFYLSFLVRLAVKSFRLPFAGSQSQKLVSETIWRDRILCALRRTVGRV